MRALGPTSRGTASNRQRIAISEASDHFFLAEGLRFFLAGLGGIPLSLAAIAAACARLVTFLPDDDFRVPA